MPTVRAFEELKIWQMARAQCQEIFELIEDGRFDLDLPLRDQINRSSGVVMDSIAEGFDRFSRADFRHFLIVARGSNAEVRSQLYRAADRRYLTEKERVHMIDVAAHLGSSINSLIHHLDQSAYSSQPTGAQEPNEPYGGAVDIFFHDLPAEHTHQY